MVIPLVALIRSTTLFPQRYSHFEWNPRVFEEASKSSTQVQRQRFLSVIMQSALQAISL